MTPHSVPSDAGTQHASLPNDFSRVGRFTPAGVTTVRFLVLVGVILLLHFLWWFVDARPIGYAPLFWPLCIALGFKLLRVVHEWYHYVAVSEPLPPAAAPTDAPALTVDVLTTACPGEPHAMIVRTLQAMQAIRYPHTSYLCDEGNDPYLRQVCAELGVVHVTRTVKVNAKAGNINNALRQATGDLCVVLDPDHVPAPDFLDRVVPYFADPTVGYVQVVQSYGNQNESLVARGAAEQTYHFYGPLMMGMNTYNTVQAIGANCTFRRSALDSIGGHAAGLTEDMHTAMHLHAKGWRSVYLPAVLSRGLVPSTLAGFYAQQLKWARGAFDLLFHVYPRLFSRFTWRQRLHYATLPLYFFCGVVALIDIVVPALALVLGEYPFHVPLGEFILHLTPVVAMGVIIRLVAQRWLREPHETGLHLVGGILRLGSWWVYTLGFLYAVVGVKVPYIPTPKDDEARNEWLLAMPNLVAAGLSLSAAYYGHTLLDSPYSRLMSSFAVLNAVLLLAAVGLGQHITLQKLINTVTSFRWLRGPVLSVERLLDNTYNGFHVRLQQLAVPAAATVFVLHLAGSASLVYWGSKPAPPDELIWARTGVGGIRTGELAPGNAASTATLPVRLASAGWTAAFTKKTEGGLVDVQLPSGLAPLASEATLAALDAQGSIPILSWEVGNGRFGDSNWQQATTRLRQRNRAVLLRPLLPASSPQAHRAAWQKLVTEYRASGDTSAVWLWTPPHPDSIAYYYPGPKYVDWILSDLSTLPNTGMDALARHYAPFRLRMAMHVELHSKPVLLLTPPVPGKAAETAAQELTQLYPEVRAVIFTRPAGWSRRSAALFQYYTWEAYPTRANEDYRFSGTDGVEEPVRLWNTSSAPQP